MATDLCGKLISLNPSSPYVPVINVNGSRETVGFLPEPGELPDGSDHVVSPSSTVQHHKMDVQANKRCIAGPIPEEDHIRRAGSRQDCMGSHWYIGRTHACQLTVRVGAGFDSQVGSVFFFLSFDLFCSFYTFSNRCTILSSSTINCIVLIQRLVQ